MNPVSMEIWLCFSLAYFAVSVVLFLTSRVVNSGWRRRIVRRPSYRSYSYPKSVNDRRKSEILLQRQKRDSNESEHSSDLSTPSKLSTRRRYQYRTRQHDLSVISNDKIKTNKQDEEKLKKKDVHLFGISNALFFSFSSFMRQPINLVPKSFSGRVAATSWWYFSLIFVSSYTANLVAFVTVDKLIPPIESVEDLGKKKYF
jgi:glutamate receptor 3